MSALSVDEKDMQKSSQGGADNGCNNGSIRVRYAVEEFPISLPFQKAPVDKPNPKQGVGMMSWSADSRYLFTRNDNASSVLWIWDISRLELAALLIQKGVIRAAAWDPVYPRVALCTGSSQLYMWTPAGACCVKVPLPQFNVLDLKWNFDGTCLLLKDKDSFCCTFVPTLPGFGTNESPEDSDSDV
ncbi:hypothetical protein KP509_19G076200 [Ceratopteris richardii]|nr:hypothetical protein KP509_19G076200 [Ceratopteris richardii]